MLIPEGLTAVTSSEKHVRTHTWTQPGSRLYLPINADASMRSVVRPRIEEGCGDHQTGMCTSHPETEEADISPSEVCLFSTKLQCRVQLVPVH